MERVDELLLVATYDPRRSDRSSTEFSEESQLTAATTLLQNPTLSDPRSNYSLLAQLYRYTLTSELIDFQRGILSPYGAKFLTESMDRFEDFRFIFQYFTPFDRHFEYSTELLSTRLTPFWYCRFARSLIDTISCLPSTVNERTALAPLCRIVLVQARELSLILEFRQLRERLLDCLDLEEGADTAVFDTVIEMAFQFAVASPYGHIRKEVLEKEIPEYFRKFAGLSKSESEALEQSVSFCDNPAAFNTQLHRFALKYGTPVWVHGNFEGEIPERKGILIENAQSRYNFVSRQIGDLLSSGEKSIGNGLLTVELESRADLSVHFKALFCYRDAHYSADFCGNKAQIVLPVYESAALEIAVQSDTRARKVLSIRLAASSQTGTLKMPGKPYQSGEISVTVRFDYFRYDRTVCPLQEFFSDSSSVHAVLDFVLHGLVLQWCDRRDSAPPPELYLFAADLCVRYCVSATHFFTVLVDKFIAGFCESGSYIDAFVSIVLSCFSAVRWCPTSVVESNVPDRIEQFLKEKIPPVLISQLSRPELVEKPSINSLLMLMSVYDDPDHISTFFADALTKSLANVVASIFGCLQFDASDTPPSAEIRELYRSCHPDETDIPMVTINVDSVIRAADLMLVRGRTINTFFTNESMPVFTNSHTDILADFSDLSYKFALVFAAVEPPPPDQATFRFLATYRQLWALTGSIADRSPVKLFDAVIGRWLSDFGAALIVRLGRTIDLDDFSIFSQRKLTSSSLTDLFAQLQASFEFIEGLHFSREEINVNVMAYLALCCSAVRTYTSELFSMFFSCFNQYGLARQLAANLHPTERILSRCQCLVLLNDLIALRGEWVEFTRKFSETYGIDMSQLPDPMHGVMNRVKSGLPLFGFQLADEIKQILWDAVFVVKKGKGKVTFELKPRAVDEAGAIPELVVGALSQYVQDVKESFAVSHRMRIAADFLRGVAFGLMEGLIPFEDIAKPDTFWGIVGVFQEVVDEVLGLFQRSFEDGDYDYLVEQKSAMDAFELLEFLIRNRSAAVNALKEFLAEIKENEPKKFIVNLMMKQQKKPAFKKIPNFSFYVN
jgi:hypothetical protein